MRLYNNNPAFGEGGPFEADSREALADEMADSFAAWAGEEWDRLADESPMIEGIPERADYVMEAIPRIRDEFIDGLDEVD